jgi:hypothetical protein
MLEVADYVVIYAYRNPEANIHYDIQIDIKFIACTHSSRSRV